MPMLQHRGQESVNLIIWGRGGMREGQCHNIGEERVLMLQCGGVKSADVTMWGTRECRCYNAGDEIVPMLQHRGRWGTREC